jgi:hypothetical protein
VLLVATLLAGCQTPAAPFDPFLAGRSTIPPPGTAVQAGPAPYYGAAPPAVSVPAPGAVYTAPGAVPAAVPAVSVPAAGGGQLPRGISAPQSSIEQPAAGNAQLARWEKSSESKVDDDDNDEVAIAKPATSRSGVVRASYDEPASEAPIRIVEPTAPRRPATASGDKVGGARTQAKQSSDKTARTEKSASRNLPELTDFPPADRKPAARWKSGN